VHGGVLGAQVPFIEKPFKLDHLLRKIREGLDSPPP